MRGICFTETMYFAIIEKRKTVTRRLTDRYRVGEVLYLKEPYFIDENGLVSYMFDKDEIERKWKNKLFIPERYARHFIKIINKRQEMLQDITEEECLKEGIEKRPIMTMPDGTYKYAYSNKSNVWLYYTAIDAFVDLFGEINGYEIWNSNPIVTRYEFEFLR